MTRPKPPLVFRITAALLVAAIAFGGWWQHQPVGPHGQAFLAAVARACPVAAHPARQPHVTDTAKALDRWAYAEVRNLLFGTDHDCCRTLAAKS